MKVEKVKTSLKNESSREKELKKVLNKYPQNIMFKNISSTNSSKNLISYNIHNIQNTQKNQMDWKTPSSSLVLPKIKILENSYTSDVETKEPNRIRVPIKQDFKDNFRSNSSVRKISNNNLSTNTSSTEKKIADNKKSFKSIMEIPVKEVNEKTRKNKNSKDFNAKNLNNSQINSSFTSVKKHQSLPKSYNFMRKNSDRADTSFTSNNKDQKENIIIPKKIYNFNSIKESSAEKNRKRYLYVLKNKNNPDLIRMIFSSRLNWVETGPYLSTNYTVKWGPNNKKMEFGILNGRKVRYYIYIIDGKPLRI